MRQAEAEEKRSVGGNAVKWKGFTAARTRTESDLVAEVGEQVDAARAGGLAHGPEEAEHREHVVVAVFEVRRQLLLDRLGHRQRQRLRTSTSLLYCKRTS